MPKTIQLPNAPVKTAAGMETNTMLNNVHRRESWCKRKKKDVSFSNINIIMASQQQQKSALKLEMFLAVGMARLALGEKPSSSLRQAPP